MDVARAGGEQGAVNQPTVERLVNGVSAADGADGALSLHYPNYDMFWRCLYRLARVHNTYIHGQSAANEDADKVIDRVQGAQIT